MVLSFWRRLLYYCLLAGLTLALVEGMARVAYYWAYGQGYQGGQQAAQDFFRQQEYRDAARTAPIAHPFYGQNAAPIFYHELNQLPPRQRWEGTALIGLLGGSVAWEAAASFQAALDEYFAAQGAARRGRPPE